MAEVNNKVCREFNIKRSVTSAYHPQTNGLDERTNQTLKVRLSKLVNDQQNDWDQYLEQVAFSIRTQKQCSTKHTPFYLMFGRNPRSPLEVVIIIIVVVATHSLPWRGIIMLQWWLFLLLLSELAMYYRMNCWFKKVACT